MHSYFVCNNNSNRAMWSSNVFARSHQEFIDFVSFSSSSSRNHTDLFWFCLYNFMALYEWDGWMDSCMWHDFMRSKDDAKKKKKDNDSKDRETAVFFFSFDIVASQADYTPTSSQYYAVRVYNSQRCHRVNTTTDST